MSGSRVQALNHSSNLSVAEQSRDNITLEGRVSDLARAISNWILGTGSRDFGMETGRRAPLAVGRGHRPMTGSYQGWDLGTDRRGLREGARGGVA